MRTFMALAIATSMVMVSGCGSSKAPAEQPATQAAAQEENKKEEPAAGQESSGRTEPLVLKYGSTGSGR